LRGFEKRMLNAFLDTSNIRIISSSESVLWKVGRSCAWNNCAKNALLELLGHFNPSAMEV